MSESPTVLLGALIERLKAKAWNADLPLELDAVPFTGEAEVVRLSDVEAALATLPQQERMFPIQGGPHVPWSIIAACESQMKANHDQSAETLARRGGLCPSEAVDVLLGRSWNTCQMSNDKAITKMLEIVQERHRLAALPSAPPQEQEPSSIGKGDEACRRHTAQAATDQGIGVQAGTVARDRAQAHPPFELTAFPPAQAQEQEEEITKLHNTCAYYEREIQRLKAALPPAHGWHAEKESELSLPGECRTCGPIQLEVHKGRYVYSYCKSYNVNYLGLPVPPSLVPTEPRP